MVAPDLDMRKLRYFVAVAEELNFGRAAERLHIAQPVLSRQIRSFESELGVQLFARDSRGTQLTAAGKQLLEDARFLLAESKALRQRLFRIAEPIVTVTVDPPRVVVGQQTTVRVTILAPNYMPAPPVLPDFQIRNAVTRGLGNVNQSETREGVTYAGTRYEAAVFPQEPGTYALR